MRTHVELDVRRAATSELLILGLHSRKGVMVEDDGDTGLLERLQSTLLYSDRSAHARRARSLVNYKVVNTPARVELGLAVDETLDDPVAKLGERVSDYSE